VEVIEAVDAILFEVVGVLAEFPGGSDAYWTSLDAWQADRQPLPADAAAESAVVYPDAVPAFAELSALGVKLIATTSLSETALTRFLARSSLDRLFDDCWSRDRAEGVGATVLQKAIAGRALAPGRALFLADTAAALQTARQAGVHGILMMNDPDEAMRLTVHEPVGGIVSLHELPEFVRFVGARPRNARQMSDT